MHVIFVMWGVCRMFKHSDQMQLGEILKMHSGFAFVVTTFHEGTPPLVPPTPVPQASLIKTHITIYFCCLGGIVGTN